MVQVLERRFGKIVGSQGCHLRGLRAQLAAEVVLRLLLALHGLLPRDRESHRRRTWRSLSKRIIRSRAELGKC